MENHDVVILGSGPGGYVTAIRASQLGFNTAIIEKESLGGICLNWGCIPTKALLKSAEVYEYLNHAESYGIEVENFSKNFEKVIERSRNVAGTMSKGVNFLMKKNKIKVYTGFGKLEADKTITFSEHFFKVTSPSVLKLNSLFLSKSKCFFGSYFLNGLPKFSPSKAIFNLILIRLFKTF